MTKTGTIRKLISKLLTISIVSIQLVFILNPILNSTVNAATDTSKCGNLGAFVNWKDCLFNTIPTTSTCGNADPTTCPPINITDSFFFINSGYTQFYLDKIKNYIPPTTTGLYCDPVTQKCTPFSLTDSVKKEYALNSTVAKVVSDIVSLVLFFMVGIFIFLLFKATFTYVTAGDEDEKIAKAKKTFKTAGMGLLIVVIGFIVISLVGSLLGLGNFWEIKLFS
ncbi:MAG: hypothetical protein WCO33_02780 [bacterium]